MTGAATRDHNRPLKVLVTDAERETIRANARSPRLTVSAYLRYRGLGYRPKSTLDHEAVLALLKVNADQGHLGGLLKLWLVSKTDQAVPQGRVRTLLAEIEAAQHQLRQALSRL